VLRDDLKLFDNLALLTTFFSLFDVNSKEKSHEFWNALQRESAVYDCELNTITMLSPEMYSFSGFVTGEEILITASKYAESPLAEFDESMQMQDEQQGPWGFQENATGALNNSRDNRAIDILNEMTQLNNELANTQRELVKQNAEINRLNKELQHVNEEMEQFSYGASHDLKEPLRMIKSFLKLLEKKYVNSLDDTARKYIHFAVDGAGRMETLINDLLEYSRAGKAKNDIKETDITEIIEEIKQLQKLSIAEKAAIIHTSALPKIGIPRAAIRQVFHNLIGNAIKYHEKGVKPVIFVKATESKTHWKFSVTDNGIGISRDNLETIFTIFKRLHSREQYPGTGIGLAICKKIIDQNGGEIWVESEEGTGSTFHFTVGKKIE